MVYVDVHVHSNLSKGENDPEEIVREAVELGFKALVLMDLYSGNIDEAGRVRRRIKELKEKFKDVTLYLGAEVKGDELKPVKKLVVNSRPYVEYLAVKTSSLEVIRWAARTKPVDSIILPFKFRRVLMDAVTARFASEGKKAVEVCVCDMFRVRGMTRALSFSLVRREISIAKHYGLPIIISSNAKSVFDLRKPDQLTAIGEVLLGLSKEAARNAVSAYPMDLLLRSAKLRRAGVVIEGVEVVGGKPGQDKNPDRSEG